MELQIRECNADDVALITRAMNKRRASCPPDLRLAENAVGSWIKLITSRSAMYILIFGVNESLIASVLVDEDRHFFYAYLNCYDKFNEDERESIMLDFERWFKNTKQGSNGKIVRWIVW